VSEPGAPRGTAGQVARVATLARASVLAAVLATVSVSAVAVAVPTGGARAAVAPAEPVTITLESLLPGLARPGTDLALTGTLDNTGTQDLRDVEVRLRLSQTRLNSRSELAAVAANRTSSRDGQVIASLALPDLGAGRSQPFDLSRSVDDLAALTEFGVYVLGVEVLASRSSGFGRVAILRTLLPWVPAEPDIEATGFTWLWPLVARPVRLADGTYTDDSLTAEMAPGGRLSRLLEAGVRLEQGAGLTWAIDPELLDAVVEMAEEDGYEVLAPDGSLVPGGGSAVAAGWLDRLEAATAGRDVLALPYGDPDITALTRAGLGADLERARERGQGLLSDALPSAVILQETAWPVDGFTNRDSLAALGSAGVSTVVLDGRALPTVIDLSYTPAGRAHVPSRAGRLAGLLADPGLADLLRQRGSDPLLGAQRLLAETAMITSELPGAGPGRTIVVMPPRRWDPSPEYLDRLAEVGAQAPWMAPVRLAEAGALDPPEVDRGPLRYPAAQRARELPAPYLSALVDMRSSIAVFTTILTNPDQLVPSLDRAVLLLESSWWRARDDRAIRLNRERGYLADLRGEVRVQPGSFTFSSRSGTIPLTVANGLDQDVRLVLRLQPQTIQLRLREPRQPIRIGPRQKTQHEVDAVAVAGGQVLVDATLETPGGTPYGQPVQVRISITDYGTVALYITVTAAGVLFLTAGVRILRRVRAARRTSEQTAP